MPVDFKKLMVTRFLFTLAVQIQSVLLGWQMYLLTKSAFYLGLIGLAEALPALGLAMYAGYIVDHSRPLSIYRRVLEISLFSAIIMLFSVSEFFGSSSSTQILTLFSASVLTGLARSFSQPSIYAIVPRIVPREKLTRASAWMTNTLQVGRISGPAIGGLLFAVFSPPVCSMIVCVVLIFATCPLFLVDHIPAGIKRTPEKRPFKNELLAGARFVFKHPILFPALTLDMIAVLFGGVTALLPIYAAEILLVGSQGLGALRASPAIGAILGTLLLSVISIKERTGRWFLFSVGGFGISIFIFAISENFLISFLVLGLSGLFDSFSVMIRSTAVQLTSPDEMRGRISAVNSMFIGSSNELGEFESGAAASILGVVPAAMFGSIICLITVAIVAWKCPTLRKLNLKLLESS